MEHLCVNIGPLPSNNHSHEIPKSFDMVFHPEPPPCPSYALGHSYCHNSVHATWRTFEALAPFAGLSAHPVSWKTYSLFNKLYIWNVQVYFSASFWSNAIICSAIVSCFFTCSDNVSVRFFKIPTNSLSDWMPLFCTPEPLTLLVAAI